MRSLSLISFSYSGRPLATVIQTTLQPMTNVPVAQQSRSAMPNLTIPVGSKQNGMSILEPLDFGLLMIWPSQPTCLHVSPVDAWCLLFFHHHLILLLQTKTISLRLGRRLAEKFHMTPSDNQIGNPCFALLK